MPPRVKSTARHVKHSAHHRDVERGSMLLDEGVLYSGCRAKYAAAFFRISRSSSVRRNCAFSLRISPLASASSLACCSLLSGLAALTHLYRLCADTPSRSETSATE